MESLSHPTLLPLRVRCLREGVQLPRYQTEHAAGLDLQAWPEAAHPPISIPPLGRCLVPTGIAVAIPVGYEAQVRPRSGWALKHGLTVLNSPGTIDSDYRGEIQVLLVNLGADPVFIQPGDRIAQLVVAPVSRVQLQEVASLEDTNRGTGGYGHTGGMGNT